MHLEFLLRFQVAKTHDAFEVRLHDPGGAEGLAIVPAGQEEATIEAAEECPGECIFIEVD